MSPGSTGGGVLLATLALASASAWLPPLRAQPALPVQDEAAHASLVEAVAERLGIPARDVRVDVRGGLPPADSVQVAPGTTDRWLVTAWRDGRASRRLARVGRFTAVPVAARPMLRGERVDAADVRLDERVLWEPHRGALDPVGLVTTRTVAEGEALAAPAVRPPLLFRGGDIVEAVLVRSGVTMRVRAEALSSAREGDQVHVRLASGKRMEARAVDDGLVYLIMGGI